MIRSFTLRDFPLVRRLSEQGISLHAESALADNVHPLRGALLNMVARREYPTLVWKSEDRRQTGFIQLLLEGQRHHAHVLYVSPSVTNDDFPVAEGEAGQDTVNCGDIWLSLLDQAVGEAGAHGVQSLVAEVDETGPELLILRRAGFVVYTRQDIWVLEAARRAQTLVHQTPIRLQPRTAADDWDIQLLYTNTVPRLVQLVEPSPPAPASGGWVLRDTKGELAAFVHMHNGSVAIWLRFFIHPDVEADAEQIILALLRELPRDDERHVYCCVRRYEGWLPGALGRAGFENWGSQAVMVKHTVQHSKHVLPRMAVALENGGMPVSSPYVQRYESKEESDGLRTLDDPAGATVDRHETLIRTS